MCNISSSRDRLAFICLVVLRNIQVVLISLRSCFHVLIRVYIRLKMACSSLQFAYIKLIYFIQQDCLNITDLEAVVKLIRVPC